MAETLIDITRRRGDTYPFWLYVTDSAGDAVNITGYTFKMTANTEEEPADDTSQVFQLTGTITDAAGGEVRFDPTEADMDHTGTLYVDVEMVDGDSDITTLAFGTLEMLQDITKPAP